MSPGTTYLYLTIGVLLLAGNMLRISGKPLEQPGMKVVINQPQTTVIIGDELAKKLISKSNYRKMSAERNNEETIKFVINKSDATTEIKNSLQVKKATDNIENMATQFPEDTSHSITYESFSVSSGEGHYTTWNPSNSSSSSSDYSSSSSCSDSISDSKYFTKEVILEESDEINTDYLSRR